MLNLTHIGMRTENTEKEKELTKDKHEEKKKRRKRIERCEENAGSEGKQRRGKGKKKGFYEEGRPPKN